ncbi:MAG: hypothetical protein A2020_04445 [Lentisphaerae bacterium GWF2_45_14]|nr:MAG: hypothetical protein A2020_04445 [Lentisphaerae bacterium GWF2_45_14]
MNPIDVSSYGPALGINSLITPGKEDKAGAADAKLKSACNDFEAVLTSIILKEGLKNAQEMGDSPGGEGEDSGSKKYNEMAYEQIAYFIGRQGTMGLGQMIYEKVKEQVSSQNIKNTEGMSNEQSGN